MSSPSSRWTWPRGITSAVRCRSQSSWPGSKIRPSPAESPRRHWCPRRSEWDESVRLPSVPSLAAASPRKLLIALGALLISSAVAVGSGADFSSTSANPGSLITTGTIVVTDSLAGQSILTASGMKPGATSSNAVDITNGGNVPAAFTLAPANLANVPASPALSARLTLQIQDLGNPSCTVSCPPVVTVYTGALGSMGTLTLGTF